MSAADPGSAAAVELSVAAWEAIGQQLAEDAALTRERASGQRPNLGQRMTLHGSWLSLLGWLACGVLEAVFRRAGLDEARCMEAWAIGFGCFLAAVFSSLRAVRLWLVDDVRGAAWHGFSGVAAILTILYGHLFLVAGRITAAIGAVS